MSQRVGLERLVMRKQEQEERDFVDELVEERTAQNPDFQRLLAAVERSRAILKELVEAREQAGLTQADVARSMGTSQPAVARLERGESDPRLSTVERYADVVGWRLEAVKTA
jgi:DNA-binding XRE family transcriptional regulator